ncbi:unnamed protein product, partial [Musa acuminata var. zebrina]
MGSSSLLRWQCFGRGRRPPSSSPSTSAMTTGRSSSTEDLGSSDSMNVFHCVILIRTGPAWFC